MKRTKSTSVAVLDLETTPFLYGRAPEPFVMGYFDGTQYVRIWDDDPRKLIARTVAFLERQEPRTIYAHNGGKFDWFFFLPHLSGERIKLINGRIALADIGLHEIRDSFSILPVPLRAFDKGDIEYWKMEPEHRHEHRDEIEEYLRRDCYALHELVSAFIDRFGKRLTIAGTALAEIRKHHTVVKCGPKHDARFRPWYFGGRVQCFERGIIRAPLKAYDVNSMYPDRMKHAMHPSGEEYASAAKGLTASGRWCAKPDAPFFIRFIGENDNAIPVRTDSGLVFDQPEGEFFCTSHELQAALEFDRVRIHRVLDILVPAQFGCFDSFVDMCIEGKLKAEADGDVASRLFHKLLANSGYGKFGARADQYRDFILNGSPADRMANGYEVHAMHDELLIWSRPAAHPVFYDVAIAASITGAARAQMLRGISQSTRPIYCDTDSIICQKFDGDIHASRLGAWKLEAEGDRIAVAGKKMYALFKGRECVKSASKGVRLEPEDIVRIARGEIIEHRKDAPTFSLGREVKFVTRKVRATNS